MGESVVERLSSSGIGMDALRGLGAGEVLVDLRSGGVEALSTLRDDRLDLCLGFDFDLGVSGSLSLSLSFTFEGMLRLEGCGETRGARRCARWSRGAAWNGVGREKDIDEW